MRIAEKLETRRPFFSFEFFPPHDDAAERTLFATIEALEPLDPGFVSITYGAGGSTRARTVELAKRLRGDVGLDVMAHVTCVGATRDELRVLLEDLQRGGIENIMALRGDPPHGQRDVRPDRRRLAPRERPDRADQVRVRDLRRWRRRIRRNIPKRAASMRTWPRSRPRSAPALSSW